MQQITIAGTIAGTDAPTLDSIAYDHRIGANPHVTDWFSADPARMSLVNPAANGGTVTSIASRRAGSTATLVADPPTMQRPNHSVSDAHFKGRGSVTHDNGGSGDRLSYTGTFPVAGNFFKIAVVHFATAPTGAMYPGLSTSIGNRHLFTASAASFLFRVGASGSNEAQASRPFQTGWTCLIGCWNAALKRARLSIDLGETWGTDIKAGAVVDSTTGLQIGHASNFSWCDHIFGDIDLSDGSDDSKALLADIRGYVTEFLKP